MLERACKAGILYGTDGNVGTLQTREPHPKQAMTPIFVSPCSSPYVILSPISSPELISSDG